VLNLVKDTTRLGKLRRPVRDSASVTTLIAILDIRFHSRMLPESDHPILPTLGLH
jgi:hypothetical protein